MMCAHCRIGPSQAMGSIICDPTWNGQPVRVQAERCGQPGQATTSPRGIPNLPWSPTVPPAPASSRSSTADPGACWAILRSSALAIGGVPPHSGLPRAGNVAGEFDRVGEQQGRRVHTGPDHRADLRPGCGLEPAPGPVQAGQQPGMRVGFDRVMDRHLRQRGDQRLETFPSLNKVEQQVRGRWLPGRDGRVTPQRAEASMPYQATSAAAFPTTNPSHTPPGSGRASHAAPARQPGRIRKLSRASCGGTRRQLLSNRVPCPGRQPAPPSQMGRCPPGRYRRLRPDAAVERDDLTRWSPRPPRSAASPVGRYPAAKPPTAPMVPHTFGKAEPGQPRPPPPLGPGSTLRHGSLAGPGHGRPPAHGVRYPPGTGVAEASPDAACAAATQGPRPAGSSPQSRSCPPHRLPVTGGQTLARSASACPVLLLGPHGSRRSAGELA